MNFDQIGLVLAGSQKVSHGDGVKFLPTLWRCKGKQILKKGLEPNFDKLKYRNDMKFISSSLQDQSSLQTVRKNVHSLQSALFPISPKCGCCIQEPSDRVLRQNSVPEYSVPEYSVPEFSSYG